MAQDDKVREGRVGKYPERPYSEAKASEKDIQKVENRPEKDQIEDYHKKNPTLKRSKTEEKAIDQQQEKIEDQPG